MVALTFMPTYQGNSGMIAASSRPHMAEEAGAVLEGALPALSALEPEPGEAADNS